MKIAAASCCKVQSLPDQPGWSEIQAARPDALLLLGDNIYLEHDHHDDPAALKAELEDLYRRQFDQQHFAALLVDMKARGAPVIAIYDDHDFMGNNRYGGDHPAALREAARAAFIGAFKPRQTGPEVYSYHPLDRVDLVVLDARFHRRHPSTSSHDRDAVLGAAQWRWLEQVAEQSKAPYLLVASSTTLHQFTDESWEQYPAAFQRLTALLKAKPGRLVVSGDIHRNETYDDDGAMEIVTSGIARRGLVFGAERRNWALMTFTPTRMDVQLASLKTNWRREFSVSLEDWRLP